MMQDIYKDLFFMCNAALDEGRHFFWTNVLQCALEHPLLGIFLIYLIFRGISKEIKKICGIF